MSPKPALFENSFITGCFRDVADHDYIAARVLYRAKLEQQFLWSALQAVEKYLKAILLYNQRDTRHLGHKLTAAYDDVCRIPDIPFDFPDDTRRFLEYVEVYGPDRYLEWPYHTGGEELFELDRAVWFIRRYCQYLRGDAKTSTGAVVSLLPAHVRHLQSPSTLAHPHRFRIRGGVLERVLDGGRSTLRSHLIWSNRFYGARHRPAAVPWQIRSVSVNPVHFLEPSVFNVMRDRVKFSRSLVDYFERNVNGREDR